MNRLITQLHGLSPSDFERVVAMLLQAQGYADVQLIGGANDRGVDITCRDADGDLIAVQCKRYEPGKRIGALAIQHLTTMAFHRRAHRGWSAIGRFGTRECSDARLRVVELAAVRDADNRSESSFRITGEHSV